MKAIKFEVRYDTATQARDPYAQALASQAYHQRVVQDKTRYKRHAKHRGEWGF